MTPSGCSTRDSVVRLLLTGALLTASGYSCEKAPPVAEVATDCGAARAEAQPNHDPASPSAQPAPSSSLPDDVVVHMPDPPTSPEARPAASGHLAARATFDDYGFPTPADVHRLCGHTVLETDGDKLYWEAFWSPRSPAVLVEDVAWRIGRDGFTVRTPGGEWRLPAGAAAPTRTLTILPPGTPGRHERCDPPPKEAQAVLVLTRR